MTRMLLGITTKRRIKMSHWREDVEGTDTEIVKAMIAYGYARKGEDEEEIVERFNDSDFQTTNAFLQVAKAAEDTYTENQVSGVGPKAAE